MGGRRNRRAPVAQKRTKRMKGLPPAPSLESLVIPRGYCLRAGKRKLRFSREDAPKALEQARIKRQRAGSAYMEERYYECRVTDGGCGDYHLTSRAAYEERGSR